MITYRFSRLVVDQAPVRRSRAILVSVVLLASPFAAEAQQATLAGTITGAPENIPLPDATVQAINTETGEETRVYSGSDGAYSFAGLPAGTYRVSAAMPCCSFMDHTEDEVVIGRGEPVRLDMRLDETLLILSDDPALFTATMRDSQDIRETAVPRDAAGRPELSGVWFHTMDPLQEMPVAQPWAEELSQSRIQAGFVDHPHTRCLPGDVYAPGAASFMLKLVQTPELMVILFEDVPGFRQVYLDGRGHPDRINPGWVGHSIGRWEGDTLVIETVGLNDRGWTETYPRTEEMRLTERLTRTAYGRIDVEVTVEDPGVFEEPWTRRMRYDLAPQEELLEFVCENNKWGRAE